MVADSTRALLLGRDGRRTRRWAVAGVALLPVSFGYFGVVTAVDRPALHPLLWWEGYALLLVGVVAVQAQRNGGLAVSWLLGFAAAVGVVLNYGGVGVTTSAPGPLELAGLALVGGLVSAAVFGTLGFGIGALVRAVGP